MPLKSLPAPARNGMFVALAVLCVYAAIGVVVAATGEPVTPGSLALQAAIQVVGWGLLAAGVTGAVGLCRRLYR